MGDITLDGSETFPKWFKIPKWFKPWMDQYAAMLSSGRETSRAELIDTVEFAIFLSRVIERFAKEIEVTQDMTDARKSLVVYRLFTWWQQPCADLLRRVENCRVADCPLEKELVEAFKCCCINAWTLAKPSVDEAALVPPMTQYLSLYVKMLKLRLEEADCLTIGEHLDRMSKAWNESLSPDEQRIIIQLVEKHEQR